MSHHGIAVFYTPKSRSDSNRPLHEHPRQALHEPCFNLVSQGPGKFPKVGFYVKCMVRFLGLV